MAEKYILRVTAGPNYDTRTHVALPINSTEPQRIPNSRLGRLELSVRIRDYAGLPRTSSRESAYFATEPHARNGDRYGIAVRFVPLVDGDDGEGFDAPVGDGGGGGILGSDLQFGNDFEKPIRDHLPPGFSTALRIVKYLIDPGLDGDPYADEPYLYGPALSSFNAVFVGAPDIDLSKGGIWVDEGGDDGGLRQRSTLGVPEEASARKKWALRQENLERWVWSHGQEYALDFFNAYLDFEKLALRLPGLEMGLMRFWDGQPLRYVLRNRSTQEPYLVIVFTLHPQDTIDADGNPIPSLESRIPIKEASGAEDRAEAGGEESDDEAKAMERARKELGLPEKDDHVETSLDDVD